MKNVLVLITLVFSVPTLMAETLMPGDPGGPWREPTPIKETPVDDATLRSLIFDGIDNIWRDIHTEEDLFAYARAVANRGGVTSERMTKMLESLVREGLQEIEKAKMESEAYWAALRKTVEPIRMLSVFPGSNTPALLRECALSKKGGSIAAMRAYIDVMGAVDASPLLLEVLIGEVVEKGGKDLNPHRIGIFRHLQEAANKLAKENKDDDVKQVYVVLMVFALMEFEPNTAGVLDQMLCEGLPDYATSFDREKAIEKFVDMPMNTDYFKNIKAEVRKIPADKRRDFKKNPLRIPKKSEKTFEIKLPASPR